MQLNLAVNALGDLYCYQTQNALDQAFEALEEMNPSCDLTNPCPNGSTLPGESSSFANSFSAVLMLLLCFFYKK